jgi:hypothetical protein
MAAPGDIHYARTNDGIDIARTAFGEGPAIVFAPGFVTPAIKAMFPPAGSRRATTTPKEVCRMSRDSTTSWVRDRRSFITGAMAIFGSAVYARTASALGRGTRGLVNAGSRILSRFGVHVTVASRDLLRFLVHPVDGIRYEWGVAGPNGVDLCWLESSLGPAVEFTNFNPAKGLADIRLRSDSGTSDIEVLDPEADLQVRIADKVYKVEAGELVRV